MSNLNQDIQVSHKILELLERANSQAEAIVDGLPGVFLILNGKGQILRGNVEAARALGVDPEDLLRSNCSRLFKHETWQIFQQHLQQVKTGSEEGAIRFELAVSGGENLEDDRPFYWRLSKIETESGAEGQLFYLMGEDITDLRETENKLSNVFANIPLGILTVDEYCKIEDTYSSYFTWLLGGGDFQGKSFSEVVFGPIEQDLSEEQLEGVRNFEFSVNNREERFEELLPTFPTQIYFYCANSKRGGKYLQISYKPVVYEGVVKRLLVIMEDRTKVVEAEKQRERANEIEQESRAVYESAIRDPLTGLFTRLYMEKEVQKLIDNHNQGAPGDVSLVMFDIDHFKPFNDNYGHDVGDRVLKQVGGIILEQVRDTDTPVRFGGEEFMVFVGGNAKAAYKLAERIRQNVEALPIEVEGQAIQITISAGAAEHHIGEALDPLTKRTDQLLYKAKEQGRNQIATE